MVTVTDATTTQEILVSSTSVSGGAANVSPAMVNLGAVALAVMAYAAF
jgi:hypothetical protein